MSAEQAFVACVCRTSQRYTPEVVQWLARQAAKNIRTPFKFICLTDQPDKMPGGVALQHDWPKWWAKLELFRPGLFPDGATVLFMDLDSVLLRPFRISSPPPAGSLGMLKLIGMWYAPVGSGVMLWRAPLTAPYDWFLPKAEEAMKVVAGDQEAIVAGILTANGVIRYLPEVSCQTWHGEQYIPRSRPPGIIWCTAGSGPRSFEVSRSWIPSINA